MALANICQVCAPSAAPPQASPATTTAAAPPAPVKAENTKAGAKESKSKGKGGSSSSAQGGDKADGQKENTGRYHMMLLRTCSCPAPSILCNGVNPVFMSWSHGVMVCDAMLPVGRWTSEEHALFLKGLEMHGKGWKKIAKLIKTRTVVQIRTHAQKYFQRMAKAKKNGQHDLLMDGRPFGKRVSEQGEGGEGGLMEG